MRTFPEKNDGSTMIYGIFASTCQESTGLNPRYPISDDKDNAHEHDNNNNNDDDNNSNNNNNNDNNNDNDTNTNTSNSSTNEAQH